MILGDLPTRSKQNGEQDNSTRHVCRAAVPCVSAAIRLLYMMRAVIIVVFVMPVERAVVILSASNKEACLRSLPRSISPSPPPTFSSLWLLVCCSRTAQGTTVG